MIRRERILTIAIVFIAIAVFALVLHDFFGFWQTEQPQQLDATTTSKVADLREHLPEPKAHISPHQDIVEALETQAGMPLSRIARLIIEDENVRYTPYLDAERKVTIGIGRSLQTNGLSTLELTSILADVNLRDVINIARIKGGRIYFDSLTSAKQVFTTPLTSDDIHLLLTDDLKNVSVEAKGVFGKAWTEIDSARQESILDVLYNLGLPHFQEFKKFIDAVKQQNWKTASAELLRSEAAHENPSRYFRNSQVIRTGDPSHFNLK